MHKDFFLQNFLSLRISFFPVIFHVALQKLYHKLDSFAKIGYGYVLQVLFVHKW